MRSHIRSYLSSHEFHRSFERAVCLLAALLVSHLLGFGQHGAAAAATFLIGDITITQTTSQTTLQKAWRKVQAPLVKAFRSRNAVWKWLKDAPAYTSIDYSAREMLIPIHITRQGGAAHIPEFGIQANPSTNPPQEITVSWSLLSQRFAASLTAKRLDKAQAGRKGQVVRQFKFQAMQAMDGVANRVTQTAFGYSTGVVCKVLSSASVSGNTYDLTLCDAYGEAAMDDSIFLAGFFAIGDFIALKRAGSLVANSAGGLVSAITPATGVIRVAFNGSLTPTAGDSVLFANNALTGLTFTLADHTDDNKWPTGMLDALKSSSVHGLATSSASEWAAGYADATGGRFTKMKYRKMRQGIKNHGGGELNELWIDEQVENDFIESQDGFVRYGDTRSFALDGAIKESGLKIRSGDRVPPGHAIGLDRNNSFHRFMGMDMPDDDEAGLGWEDGEKIPHTSAMAFSIEFEYGYVTTNRGNMAYCEQLTRQ
jgi:hypothetical protein